MGNMTVAVVFVVMLHLLCFLANTAIADPEVYDSTEPPTTIFNCSESLLGVGMSSNCQASASSDQINNNLPVDLAGTDPAAGSNFMSWFFGPLSWIKGTGTWILKLLFPLQFLLFRMFPTQTAMMIGISAAWTVIELMIIIGFIFGRE
jgi:hypothetical protein